MSTEDSVLFVRHLPSELTVDEKEDLLKHFGAVRVRCFGNTGRMRHTAFATFPDHATASKALERLHQLEVLGTRLSVEFSKSQMAKYHPSMVDPAPNVDINNADVPLQKDQTEDEMESFKRKVTEEINCISSRWGVEYPYNPKLQYLYPSPTVNILMNIANALASVPRFYVQVLHLMNKMNLPPPFGPLTAMPPIPEGEPPPLPPLPEGSSQSMSEETESELESDEDTKSRPISVPHKRVMREVNRPKKKHKLQINPPVVHTERQSHLSAKPEEIFDQPQVAMTKKIEFKLSASIAESLQNATASIPTVIPSRLAEDRNVDQQLLVSNQESTKQPKDLLSILDQEPDLLTEHKVDEKETSTASEVLVTGGFGKMEPQRVQEKEAESSDSGEEMWGAAEFISSRRLRKGRLSSAEARELSVLKNYTCGEPTPRLYIKNLAKQTTEKDLHHIYGRYVDWDDELEKNMFDIRLMKEGRMKGQAFVTLPNEEAAKKALEETHTFVLNDKPMVVQFARSAKPKDTTLTK